jgi:hypothetical protein
MPAEGAGKHQRRLGETEALGCAPLGLLHTRRPRRDGAKAIVSFARKAKIPCCILASQAARGRKHPTFISTTSMVTIAD